MLDSLPDVPLAPQEDSVASRRCTSSELVQGQAFSSGGSESFTGRGGESESGDGELGDGRESLVVEDSADHNDGLAVVGVGVLSVFDDFGDGDGGSVDLQVGEQMVDRPSSHVRRGPSAPARRRCSTCQRRHPMLLQQSPGITDRSLTLLIKRRLRMTLLNLESVLLARKR